jgi:hypothetical protein
MVAGPLTAVPSERKKDSEGQARLSRLSTVGLRLNLFILYL